MSTIINISENGIYNVFSSSCENVAVDKYNSRPVTVSSDYLQVIFPHNTRFYGQWQNRQKYLQMQISVLLKPQSHIHDFGPGRAMVHPDVASR